MRHRPQPHQRPVVRKVRVLVEPPPARRPSKICSRRRDCDFAGTPSSSLLKRLLKGEGGEQQNGSLADGSSGRRLCTVRSVRRKSSRAPSLNWRSASAATSLALSSGCAARTCASPSPANHAAEAIVESLLAADRKRLPKWDAAASITLQVSARSFADQPLRILLIA